MTEEKQGSVVGSVLLIAGSCIGAGMLALPTVSAAAGFGPSMLLFVIAWLFMLLTGFFLLEANLTLGHHLSLISIAEKTLGKTGKVLAWVLFVFLFYSLSVAYISASGSILTSIFGFESWIGSLFFTAVFALFLFFGVRHVDYLNRLLMLGLILSYCVMVFLGSLHVHLHYLGHTAWKYALPTLPVLVVSFGFHNMIPSMAMYMRGDVGRLRIVLLLGSFIPLLIYFIWLIVMLGIIPYEQIGANEISTKALQQVVGRSWVSVVAQSFALFAIVTSFLAQSLSLVDFLSDGLKIPKVGMGRFVLILLTLVPPFFFAFLYPDIFVRAINFGGGFSAVILFGVMPALMVWVLRYRKRVKVSPLLPCGKVFLVVILAMGVGIFCVEALHELRVL